MASNNVAQFAAELKMPAGVLLEQLQAAGVTKASEDDDLSETDKSRLLEHLRKSHGSADADKRKITLTRRHTSEIKQSDSTGKARTIQVEVRKKRVFVKRDESGVEQVVEGANHVEEDEVDEAELQRRDEEARQAAELLEKEALELKERQERFEREEAERVAWRAPGVTKVEDHIVVRNDVKPFPIVAAITIAAAVGLFAMFMVILATYKAPALTANPF